MKTNAPLFALVALMVVGAGCATSPALGENQCSYDMGKELLRCGMTYVVGSSALPAEVTLEKGEEIQVPKNRLLTISEPKVGDEQVVYHFLYLDETRVYQVGEEETKDSMQRRLQVEVDRRNQPAQ